MVWVEGVVPTTEEAELRRLVEAAAGGAFVEWRVTGFDGPYCPVLDLLRPHGPRFGVVPRGLAVTPLDGRARLAEGERLVLRVASPDFASTVRLDYLETSGRVSQMQPSEIYPAPRTMPGEHYLWGDDRPNLAEPPRVQPPFGTDLVIAIASETALSPAPAGDHENPERYTAQLRAALDAALRRREIVAVHALVVTVLPAR
jgi:hypothetical protein